MARVSIAGHTVDILGLSEIVEHELTPYASTLPAEASFTVTDAEIQAARDPEVRLGRDTRAFNIAQRKLTHWLLDRNVTVVHGVAMLLDGNVYLVTAPSGIGKTTHALLWKEHFGDRLTIINGDKPFVDFTRPDLITVHASPWSGKEHFNTPGSGPLRGIIVVEQAPDDSIRPLAPDEAIDHLAPQVFRPVDAAPEATMQWFEQATRLSTQVPVYLLRCTISPTALALATQALLA